MVRLVDEALRDERRFGVAEGLASQDVTLADPAMGTGTFLLGVLQRIADRIEEDQGTGAVPAMIRAALARMIGFEIQFGPFAVTQLRLTAEVLDLLNANTAEPEHIDLRLFLTDTLGNPDEEHEYIPHILSPLAASRRSANQIKRAEPITVVIGNPPYRERARGRGGWVESGTEIMPAPLRAWVPPVEWGVSAHAKHLRNLYVYFWRWATWKVFGGSIVTPGTPLATPLRGIVCFITVAGFLNGPGFAKMRSDLRRDTDEIWVIDCSPEGHQPLVASRIFQAVQQPVCIVLAVRLAGCDPDAPARVRFRSLPVGTREDKFEAISAVTLDSGGWTDCPSEWRAPFLPEATGEWDTFPALEDFFVYNGSGVMPGRTWVIAPDKVSLARRWERLVTEANPEKKASLFHPHLRDGNPGDKHLNKTVRDRDRQRLGGHPLRVIAVANDFDPVIEPERYGFRSFDRQWIIPDVRLINQPNPTLWKTHSTRQVYLTAPHDRTPTNGPALTFTALIPDLHHYHGRGGRAFPLWANAAATEPNIRPAVLTWLSEIYGRMVSAEDVIAYLAAVAANPAYTARFAPDLVQPGLQIPLTGDTALFEEAVRLGREVIWLHTFGERFVIPPRAGLCARRASPKTRRAFPATVRSPPIPSVCRTRSLTMPSIAVCGLEAVTSITSHRRSGLEVSGKHVLTQWFSYRKRNRERAQIGDRRTPSPLGDIQPDAWPAEYTTELLNVLHVLGRLVALEPAQADLLERICAGPTLTEGALRDTPA